MNKSQLIETLSARFEGNRKQAAYALESVIDTITREVAKGEKVAITGFGSFEKRVRDARWVRNPRTGERIKAKKTAIPKFSAGAELKAVVSGAKKLPKLTLDKAASAAKAAAPAKKAAPGQEGCSGQDRRQEGAGQEGGSRQEGSGCQEDGCQEGGSRQEGSGEEDRGQEGTGQEDDGEEDRQEVLTHPAPEVGRSRGAGPLLCLRRPPLNRLRGRHRAARLGGARTGCRAR